MKFKTVVLIGLVLSGWVVTAATLSYFEQRPPIEVCVVAEEPTAPESLDWDIFIEAMIEIESGGNPLAVGTQDDVGILQIRPIMVREANRILGRDVFKLEDRYSRDMSILIFTTVQNRHNPNKDFRKACKIWNSGGGDAYYNRVMRKYNQISNNV